MAQIFKMGWSKAPYYISAVGIGVMLIFPYVMFAVGVFFVGILFLATILFTVWFQWKIISKSRYELNGDEIIIKVFWCKQRVFLINKIKKIEYVDLGTDFVRNTPNSRHQLAIYFERKYLKSVEPRLFGPEERDAFVKAILEVNPEVVVDENERVID